MTPEIQTPEGRAFRDATAKLPKNPWLHIGQLHIIHDPLNPEVPMMRFRAGIYHDEFSRRFAQWELVEPEGKKLGITAWAVYEDGVYVNGNEPPEETGPVGDQGIPDAAGPPEFVEDFPIPERDATTTPVPPVPVMIIDDGDDTAAAKARSAEVEASFGTRPFFWKDKQLAPFAIDREGDWLRHRELLEEAPLEEIIRLPFAMLPEAMRVLWFLSHEPKEWLGIPGMKQVETEDGGSRWIRLTGKERAMILEEKIRAWGAENIHHSEAQTAVLLFYDIYASAQSTRAVAKPGERHDDQKAKN